MNTDSIQETDHYEVHHATHIHFIGKTFDELLAELV